MVHTGRNKGVRRRLMSKIIHERKDVAARCMDYEIPEHMWDGIERYIFDKIPGGSFMTAVMCNDLSQAAKRSDRDNCNALGAWGEFLFDCMPYDSFGSPLKVERWLNNDKCEEV